MKVRPIDANALKRNWLYGDHTKRFADDYIDSAPTLDYEPVVHCKDCKYFLKNKMLCLHKENRAFNTGIIVHNNHFCSYGAKMDEEVKG